MKEKYEQEMKKEIKKLQRIRDYFRQALGNSEVKDKTKADEARKRVEMVSWEWKPNMKVRVIYIGL